MLKYQRHLQAFIAGITPLILRQVCHKLSGSQFQSALLWKPPRLCKITLLIDRRKGSISWISFSPCTVYQRIRVTQSLEFDHDCRNLGRCYCRRRAIWFECGSFAQKEGCRLENTDTGRKRFVKLQHDWRATSKTETVSHLFSLAVAARKRRLSK